EFKRRDAEFRALRASSTLRETGRRYARRAAGQTERRRNHGVARRKNSSAQEPSRQSRVVRIRLSVLRCGKEPGAAARVSVRGSGRPTNGLNREQFGIGSHLL